MENFPQITLWVTAILALMSIPMSMAVGFRRVKTGISLLHGDDADLLRRMRAHGNFTEYVPLALLALAAAEIAGAAHWLLLICGGALIVARIVHYAALRMSEDSVGRAIGAALTQLAILVLAIATLQKLIAMR